MTSAPHLRGAAHDMGDRGAVAGADMAAHRNAGKAERERWLERLERLFGAFAAGIAVGNQADAMAARGLFARQVDDVAKQAADRRAKDMQDVQGTSSMNAALAPA